MRGELERARRILDAGLACANDLGLFAEEGDPWAGRMLGNFPVLLERIFDIRSR